MKEKPYIIRGKHKPKPTVIYCLKDPTRRNRIFYVGKTSGILNSRLSAHIHTPCNDKNAAIIAAILAAGKRPSIHILEYCTGYHQPYVAERKWVAYYNRRKEKLTNSSLRKQKKTTRVYW